MLTLILAILIYKMREEDGLLPIFLSLSMIFDMLIVLMLMLR